MHQLATKFWDKNNKDNIDLCRIQWVVHQVTEYFNNGGLDKAQEKECLTSVRYFGKDTTRKIKKLHSENQKLNLLDVGSCYNPFKKFSIFNVIAVDLVPATTDVLQCDFLAVEVVIEEINNKPTSCCKQLSEASFDIVVFSLLLEYLPSSEQRYLCCQKAHKLLKTDGLLCILTPDSKHATANSKLMKNWRYCLASLGFSRITYQKLKHIHCMVYRKCQNPNITKHWLSLQCSDVPQQMMSIPQDFREYLDGEEKYSEERSEVENEELINNFNVLSVEDVFS